MEKLELKKIITQLQEDKIIRPSNSEYASPIVLVKKRNNDYRMCVDFRQLNKYIERENYPISIIEDAIGIGGEKIFQFARFKRRILSGFGCRKIDKIHVRNATRAVRVFKNAVRD